MRISEWLQSSHDYADTIQRGIKPRAWSEIDSAHPASASVTSAPAFSCNVIVSPIPRAAFCTFRLYPWVLLISEVPPDRTKIVLRRLGAYTATSEVWRFDSDRLRAALEEKGWEPADLHRETKTAYSTIGRYLKDEGEDGAGAPTANTLAKIVTALQLDADWLIDTDERYGDMEPLRALTDMALDRYLTGERLAGQAVEQLYVGQLRDIADRVAEPPLWVKDWKKQHDALIVSAEHVAEPRSGYRPRRSRRKPLEH